jgi:protein TonB
LLKPLTVSVLLHAVVLAAAFSFAPSFQRWQHDPDSGGAPAAPVMRVTFLTVDQTLALTHKRQAPTTEQTPSDSAVPSPLPRADTTHISAADLDESLPPLDRTRPTATTSPSVPAVAPPPAPTSDPVTDPPLPQPVVVAAAPAPVMVGSAEPDRSASLVRMPKPKYPDESRQAGREGLVLLDMLIDERGRVASVRVLQAPGDEALVEAAIAAARRARFEPATRLGRPVSQRVRLPIRFQLDT